MSETRSNVASATRVMVVGLFRRSPSARKRKRCAGQSILGGEYGSRIESEEFVYDRRSRRQ